MDLPKRKAPAIRADPSQTALLKSLFALSPIPSVQAIRELSQQTGLPDKWISAWFGRQRTKARKAGAVIDTTTSSVRGALIKAETQEPSEPPSSSPRSIVPDAAMVRQTPTRTARRKAPRARGKRAQKITIKPEPQDAQVPQPSATRDHNQAQPPKLLPSVLVSHTFQEVKNELSVQSKFPIPPPTRSREFSAQGPENSIYSQYGLNYPTIASLVPSAGYPSTPAFAPHVAPHRQGPIMRSNFRNSMPSDYRPECAEVTAHQKDFKPKSGHSSPTLDKGGVLGTDHTQSVANTTSAYEVPSIPGSGAYTVQDTLAAPSPTVNFPSSAFATYMALHNHPAAYQALLQQYATLFPGMQRSWNEGVPTQATQSLTSELSSSGYSYSCVQAGIAPSTDINPRHTDRADCKGSQTPSAGLPIELNNDTSEHSHCFTNVTKGTRDTPWDANLDVLDLSSLHYDYAPFSHLQDALEPFRLPESNYLFGREGVANYLLDERLAVEEPFQAAMGLVLLSELGLEW